MNNQVTSNQIAELTLLISSLENKQAELTEEEHTLLSPIMEAAQPLLDALEDLICEELDEEEDWD